MKEIDTYVAGVKFRPAESRDALAEAKNGTELQLLAEPTNKYDPNAVRVLLDSPTGQHFVGFVPKHLSKEVAEALNNPDVQVHACKVTVASNGLRIEIASDEEITDGASAPVTEANERGNQLG